MFNNCVDAEKEFNRCWENPNYTAIVLDDVDVNQALSHYLLEKPLHFTKTMLWDMERKKSGNPGQYIPYVVKAGSAKAWGKKPCSKTDGELFVRCSAQKKWLDPESYEDVCEEVYVNEKTKIITFLGVTQLPGLSKEIHPAQPLFHVQHGASGDENNPKNTWRIVLLTKHKDESFIKVFERMNNSNVLPGFITAYIENDLKIKIKKR